ncbi:expressed unknown protein [Seminavis robusta]|uniref:Uncharacterized protein n=1 Tax=Seminavis robusta TaxID=568900 RepID=A0A9N8DAR9_9STRA|nr:expressed unknown protein [Seminavis robusta]|eukprot:Sro17_g012620.1 n/a (284) ;mRNA; f:165449-166300
MANPFPLLELPESVLSTSLGSFLDGKSMSTFLIVVQGSRECDDDSVLGLLRNALVHRYGQLYNRLSSPQEEPETEEIRDVLLVTKEEVRTSESIAKFPEWCAVLDYFEKQLAAQDTTTTDMAAAKWIVWCGPIETVYGPFPAALECSTEWSLGALEYWNEVELEQFSIVHPNSRSVNDQQYDLSTYYGTVQSLTEEGRLLLANLYLTLEHDPNHWEHYLLLRSRSYDDQPTEFWTPKTGHPSELLCFWDSQEQAYDWEDALNKLGDNVIRIMARCIEQQGSFP